MRGGDEEEGLGCIFGNVGSHFVHLPRVGSRAVSDSTAVGVGEGH